MSTEYSPRHHMGYKESVRELAATPLGKACAIVLLANTIAGVSTYNSLAQRETPEEGPSPQAEVVAVVDNYLQDPVNNPLPEDVKIIETVVEPGNGAITIGDKVINKLVKEGALTSDEANNARGTVSLTIHATGGTIHPGDVIEFSMGDLNNDGEKEVVITGATHNSPYDPY